MQIGIDIDGVLTNDDDFTLDYATKFCYDNNLDTYADAYGYETRKFDWDKSISKKYIDEYFELYVNNDPPRRFASDIVKKLREEGNKVYIITSRRMTTEEGPEGEKMRDSTKNWLKKNNIFYDEIYFVKDKTVEIKRLGIDIMVEDSPKTIPNFVNYTHVFCFDCRYNRELKCDNMTRVFSWYDIYRKIKNK